MANRCLMSTGAIVFIVILTFVVIEIFGFISFSQYNVSQLYLVDNSVDRLLAQHSNQSTLQSQSQAHSTEFKDVNNCDFLIYQCAVGSQRDILSMFEWSYPWILTVRHYAKKHDHCYKFDIFEKQQVYDYLNENGYSWRQSWFVLMKTFGLYCMEYALTKYTPKWLLYVDIDVAVPPQTMHHHSLQSILTQIQHAYNMDERRFYDEVTFIAQDLKWTLNSGVVFLNNNHNNHQQQRVSTSSFDLLSVWTDMKQYKYERMLLSPKLQQFFDRIKGSLRHREYSLVFGYDQIVFQDVVLFYANVAYLNKQGYKLNDARFVDEHFVNQTNTDDEYLFYDRHCLEVKVTRDHNNCYWGLLNSWNFTYGHRQFGPVLLVSEHKVRLNMHNQYLDGDIFLHSRGGIARNQTLKWLSQYNEDDMLSLLRGAIPTKSVMKQRLTMGSTNDNNDAASVQACSLQSKEFAEAISFFESQGVFSVVRRSGVQHVINLDLSYMIERLVYEEEFESESLAMQAMLEYKKYLLVALYAKYLRVTASSQGRPASFPISPSKPVDKIWHAHILNSQQYMIDCDAIFGHYMHHIPFFDIQNEEYIEYQMSAYKQTINWYAQIFGYAPDVKHDNIWSLTQMALSGGDCTWHDDPKPDYTPSPPKKYKCRCCGRDREIPEDYILCFICSVIVCLGFTAFFVWLIFFNDSEE